VRHVQQAPSHSVHGQYIHIVSCGDETLRQKMFCFDKVNEKTDMME
jgi:hypothetical protein